MYSGPITGAAGQDLHGRRTSCKDQGLFMAVRPVGRASRVKTPHFNGCGGWYLAACVVPVQIVKDVIVMGGKTASTTVCDLTANQKVMFGLSRSRKITLFP